MRNPEKELYLDRSRIWYPEGVAPFGELNLVRIDHTIPDDRSGSARIPSFTLVSSGASIICSAWANSEWLKHDAGAHGDEPALEEQLRKNLGEGIGQYIIHAAFHPAQQSAWFAIKPPIDDLKIGEGIFRGLGTYLSPNQVVGIGTANHDVSGNVLERAWKRVRHPEKVYAKLGDLAVMPKHQGYKIGTALHFASLHMFKPGQRPTTYVAESNEKLISHFNDLGYKPTGSHPRTDFVDGVTVDEVRLEAPSAYKVMMDLMDKDDAHWLAQGRSTSKRFTHLLMDFV